MKFGGGSQINWSAPWIAVALLISSFAAQQPIYSAQAQTSPSRLQGPVPAAPAVKPKRNQLSQEQFRRKAAEAAQKQLENLAAQLRGQLVKAIEARKTAESKLADVMARSVLSDQMDEERRRLRDDKVKDLEARRAKLEQDRAELTERLKLEIEKNKTLQTSSKTSQRSDDAASIKKLAERNSELEQRLKAAEWARKLAEAQLKLVTQRQNQPTE